MDNTELTLIDFQKIGFGKTVRKDKFSNILFQAPLVTQNNFF